LAAEEDQLQAEGGTRTKAGHGFLSTAASAKNVDLPDFDMSNLTDAEMNTTCGGAFEAARSAAWGCMKVAQTSVNSGSVQVEDYYVRLCSCSDVFEKGMSSCLVQSDLIKARVDKAQVSLEAICAVGESVSWFAKHKAIIVGFAAFASGLCCLCIVLAMMCCCCKRK